MSSQSNFVPITLGIAADTVPEREAKRIVWPAAERRGAIRLETFPVVPRREDCVTIASLRTGTCARDIVHDVR